MDKVLGCLDFPISCPTRKDFDPNSMKGQVEETAYLPWEPIHEDPELQKREEEVKVVGCRAILVHSMFVCLSVRSARRKQ